MWFNHVTEMTRVNLLKFHKLTFSSPRIRFPNEPNLGSYCLRVAVQVSDRQTAMSIKRWPGSWCTATVDRWTLTSCATHMVHIGANLVQLYHWCSRGQDRWQTQGYDRALASVPVTTIGIRRRYKSTSDLYLSYTDLMRNKHLHQTVTRSDTIW